MRRETQNTIVCRPRIETTPPLRGTEGKAIVESVRIAVIKCYMLSYVCSKKNSVSSHRAKKARDLCQVHQECLTALKM